MKLVRRSALMRWTQFKEHRQLMTGEYVDWLDSSAFPAGHPLVFVSHRWMTFVPGYIKQILKN